MFRYHKIHEHDVKVTWSSRLTLQGIGRECMTIRVGAWVHGLLKLESYRAADSMYGYNRVNKKI